jgi:hypothetical protein
VEIFLTSVDDYCAEEFIEPSVSVELCLTNEESYVGDMQHESHEERSVNHGLPSALSTSPTRRDAHTMLSTSPNGKQKKVESSSLGKKLSLT